MNRRKSTTMIILHCAATPEGKDYKASDIKKWHKQRGFEDIGYHYIIDLDGTIEKGRDESMQGAHCTGKNAVSIGICYVGGCDKNMKPKDTRTYKQKQSLLELVHKLLDKYNIPLSKVYGHRTFSSKACPSFSNDQFYKEYNDYFNNK